MDLAKLDLTRDLAKLDLTRAEHLDAAEKQMLKDNQQYTIDSLKEDFLVPLPEALKERGEILANRNKMIDALKRYHKLLNRPLPVIDENPNREAVDAYETPFLIDNWMPANRLTLLTGPGGAGKSYLALQHVVGLASGVADHQLRPFYGDIEREKTTITPNPFRKEPIRVLIASYEEDRMETWKRISRICDGLGWPDYELLRAGIRFVDLKKFGPIWGVQEDTHLAIRGKMLEMGEWLFDQCQAFEAKLLMVDPSAGGYGGNENARESVREFCSYINGWGQEVECATLLIAHPPKTGDDYSGSTDWLGSCRAMWTLRTESETTGTRDKPITTRWYQLTNVKQNYAAPQHAVPLRKIEDTTRGKYTPVWERCSQGEAVEFYEAYHHPQEERTGNNTESEVTDDTTGNTTGNTTEDTDPYEEAIARHRR